jgi:predicted ATPase
MTEADFQAIREQITAFDDIQWIDDAAREIAEKFMPDLAGRLPAKRTETFEQSFGRMRAKAKRRVAAKARPMRRR